MNDTPVKKIRTMEAAAMDLESLQAEELLQRQHRICKLLTAANREKKRLEALAVSHSHCSKDPDRWDTRKASSPRPSEAQSGKTQSGWTRCDRAMTTGDDQGNEPAPDAPHRQDLPPPSGSRARLTSANRG